MEQTENNADDAWAFLDAQALALDSELTTGIVNTIEQKTASAPEPETAELLAPVIKITADLIAPNWELSESECEQLGGVYGALLDKYLPDNGLNNYGVEITALLTTGIIFGARKGVPMRKPKKKETSKITGNSDKAANKKQFIQNQTSNGVLMPKVVIDV